MLGDIHVFVLVVRPTTFLALNLVVVYATKRDYSITVSFPIFNDTWRAIQGVCSTFGASVNVQRSLWVFWSGLVINVPSLGFVHAIKLHGRQPQPLSKPPGIKFAFGKSQNGENGIGLACL